MAWQWSILNLCYSTCGIFSFSHHLQPHSESEKGTSDPPHKWQNQLLCMILTSSSGNDC